MNKTKIEWTDYTWNPVTGCRHGCWYCYARRLAEGKLKKMYPQGFEPTFWPDRLGEPYQVKEPSKIFVCSMADLFGEWVPGEWIEAVMEVVRANPKHTFQFLTKNQGRLEEWKFPRNAWVGRTITSVYNEDLIYPNSAPRGTCRRIIDMEGIDAPVKFVSFEPLLDIEVPPVFKGVNWVIVGAMTGPGAIRPRREWVEAILEAAGGANIPVFLKDNLLKLFPDLPKRREFL